MKTIKIRIIHPETLDQMEIDAPVSKLKIPIDIFVSGQEVLIIRFRGTAKRRAILETDENNHIITKAKGRVWRFAGVALVTKDNVMQYALLHKGHPRNDPDNIWIYHDGYNWRSNSR